MLLRSDSELLTHLKKLSPRWFDTFWGWEKDFLRACVCVYICTYMCVHFLFWGGGSEPWKTSPSDPHSNSSMFYGELLNFWALELQVEALTSFKKCCKTQLYYYFLTGKIKLTYDWKCSVLKYFWSPPQKVGNLSRHWRIELPKSKCCQLFYVRSPLY